MPGFIIENKPDEENYNDNIDETKIMENCVTCAPQFVFFEFFYILFSISSH